MKLVTMIHLYNYFSQFHHPPFKQAEYTPSIAEAILPYFKLSTKFVDLRYIVSSPSSTSSVGMGSIPGDLYFFQFLQPQVK
jgi:hypothetical protein